MQDETVLELAAKSRSMWVLLIYKTKKIIFLRSS